MVVGHERLAVDAVADTLQSSIGVSPPCVAVDAVEADPYTFAA